jgi:prepilin-type N-terminal cleavage/methylation domain-containing protein
MKTHAKNHQAGFTLIEFIVGLVVAGIMAAMVYTYFGSALTQSSVPIARLQKSSKLGQVMERIVADYNRLNALNLRYQWQANTTYTVGSAVIQTSNGDDQHYYKCTQAGTSGASAPTWGTTVTDNTVRWMEGGVIWKASGTPTEDIVWHKSHAYAVDDIMIPITNNGHYYRCITAGTSSSTVPVFVTWKASTAYLVNNTVFHVNGRYYRCTTAGTSGAVAPTWPTTNGYTVSDNTVIWTEVPDGTGALRWTEAGTILARNGTTASNNEAVLDDNMSHYLTDHKDRYGTAADYTVVTGFIQFNGTAEVVAGASSTSSEKNILKVTISNDSGEALTELFTIR